MNRILILLFIPVVLLFSINTVFADSVYTFIGDTTTSTVSSFAHYNNSSSGLTYEYGISAPQKTESDTSYHVYGTSKIDDFNGYKYAFSKSVNEQDFTDKTSYSFSTDVYFPTILNETELHRSEIVISSGANNITPNVVFMAGAFDNTRVFDGKTFVVENVGYDKWHNVVINMTFDGTTLNQNIYIDGNLVTEYYSVNSSGTWVKSTVMPISNTASVPLSSGYHMLARLTLNYVTGEIHDFYFDNVKYQASSFIPDQKAVIETALDGIVKVYEGTTADEILSLSNAVACEIYRPDSNSYTFVEDDFETGDIVKLVTQNGTYSYYTLAVMKKGFVIDSIVYPPDSISANDEITTEVSLSGTVTNKDVTIILCLYKGITLIDMQTLIVPEDTDVSKGYVAKPNSITVPNEDGNYIAKVFVWNTFDNMQQIPISN